MKTKECDAFGKSLKNVLFASQKKYYMWGGIDENPSIRMYNLYEPHPHFTYHTDIGMVPHMKEAKAWCTFYEPIDQRNYTGQHISLQGEVGFTNKAILME